MKFLTSQWIAKSLKLPSPEKALSFSHLTSDTREVKPGSVFVALKGENTDGHNFIEQALQSGATAVVHRKGFAVTKAQSFAVDDTLYAWRHLAASWRNEFTVPVIAICGSSGKTSSKELLAAILRGKYKEVLQTIGSQNGFQGIPSTLLRLREHHQVAVIEVGIDEIGAMAQHLEIVNPNAGLLSSIGPEHLEKLIDLDAVEKEEGLLFDFLERKKAIAAVNLDDPRIANQAKILKNSTQITYGCGQKADLSGQRKGETLHISWEKKNFILPLPLPGEHNALNLLGAAALAKLLGLTFEEMAEGLKTFTPPPGRSEIHQWKGRTVIADTYNANPSSVTAAIRMLAESPGQSCWICLGDMLEMGTKEEELHRGLWEEIVKAKPKQVLLYGPRMKHLADELLKKNFLAVAHFEKHEELAAALERSNAGDKILIKGSRGMRMEKVWQLLSSR